MAGSTEAPADLFVVGANHRSSSVALRDRLFVDDATLPAFFHAMREGGVRQAVVLSTCDRVEVQGAHGDPDAAFQLIAGWLAEHAGLPIHDVFAGLYLRRGSDAARQIFAVAASLDSMMIGETQVAGQVRAGHRLAQAAGMTGPELEAVLQAAYATAKRIREETSIGERPVSMAAAAAQLARDVHGDLSRCAALMLGLGEMGETLAARLLDAGLGRLVVAHPSANRSEAFARRLGCHHHPFDQFAAALPDADVVITALGDGRSLLTPEMMTQALQRRRHRPIFVIDAAVPADVDPAVDRLDDLFLYGLDDLEDVALAGRAGREAAAHAAWDILDAELAAYLERCRARRAVPALQQLRAHFERVRADVLASGEADPGEATRRLVNRLLHDPSEVLRQLAGDVAESRAEALLRRLFRLEGGPVPQPDEEEEETE
jgi:glutamyl-tRNA reductase